MLIIKYDGLTTSAYYWIMSSSDVIDIRKLRKHIRQKFPSSKISDLLAMESDQMSKEGFLELSKILLTLLRNESDINILNKINKKG